jgi:integrase/recombinase XerD
MKTYLNEMAQLLQTIQKVSADALTPEHLRRYLVYCHEKLRLSENTLHSRINALKFYYEQVLFRKKFFYEIPRPRKALLLPKLLNERELSALFNALENRKHKAMLFTVYSAGLRVSEIVQLRIDHIDSGRMQILVQRAKGKKDRYVNLSPVLLDILREYLKTYRPRPRLYLFESEQTFTAYPARTVQQIFSNAKRSARIRKEVGIHSLRHSFATHLLDKGTDIKYIKDLLGHFNIKTTERYLHVSKKQLVNIASPFDDLWKKQQINW